MSPTIDQLYTWITEAILEADRCDVAAAAAWDRVTKLEHEISLTTKVPYEKEIALRGEAHSQGRAAFLRSRYSR